MASREHQGATGELLLGTVAIEPNRWGTRRPDRTPEVALVDWIDRIRTLDVDGLEVWEGHAARLADHGVEALRDAGRPVRILNSYASFDDDGARERAEAAELCHRLGVRAVKFNVGADADAEDRYADRLAEWVDLLGDDVVALCECHRGISIAEDPRTAARIFEAAGPPERVQALVHTHDEPELLKAKFDAYGDRIRHVHVNFLDFERMRHPRLDQIEDRVATAVDEILGFGFTGSWTLEFVAGLLTHDDEPGRLLDQAERDLAVLRALLPTAVTR